MLLLAEIMRQSFRSYDKLFRFGGEEFVVILRSTDQEGALKIAELLRTIIEGQNIKINTDKYIKLTISLGISSMKSEDYHISEVLNRADITIELSSLIIYIICVIST